MLMEMGIWIWDRLEKHVSIWKSNNKGGEQTTNNKNKKHLSFAFNSILRKFHEILGKNYKIPRIVSTPFETNETQRSWVTTTTTTKPYTYSSQWRYSLVSWRYQCDVHVQAHSTAHTHQHRYNDDSVNIKAANKEGMPQTNISWDQAKSSDTLSCIIDRCPCVSSPIPLSFHISSSFFHFLFIYFDPFDAAEHSNASFCLYV